jgi:hypothetical protein
MMYISPPLTLRLRRHYHFAMTNLKDITVVQLKRTVAIKEEIEALQAQLDSIEGGGGRGPGRPKGKRRMSRAGRAAIAAGARARWAKIKGNQAGEEVRPTQQSGNEGEACSGCPGEVGQGQKSRQDDVVRFVAVLGIPPVEWAETAVRVRIVKDAKGKK